MPSKNKKSLLHKLSIMTSSALALVAILIVSTVLFTILMKQFNDDTASYRESMTTINTIVSNLREFQVHEDAHFKEKAVESFQRLLNLYPAWLDGSSVYVMVNTISSDDSAQMEEIMGIMGLFARQLGNLFYENRSRYFVFGLIGNGLILLIACSILILVFFVRKDFRFLGLSLNDVLIELRDFIDFKKSRPDFETEWGEVDGISKLLVSIEKEIRYSREINELDIQGNLERFIYQIHSLIAPLMPADRVAFAFLDSFDRVIAESAVVNGVAPILKPGFSEILSNTSLPGLVKSGESRIINDLPEHYKNVHQSGATSLLLEEGVKSSITLPVFIKDRCIGFLFVSSFQLDAYREKDVDKLKIIGQQLKHQLYFHYILQEIIAETARSFVLLMEKKDNETSHHILRMSRYSHILANYLSQEDPQVTTRLVREILWFAPLHDIGKVGIPDRILLKNGPLNEEERLVMNSHVQIGEQVLARMNVTFMNIIKEPVMQTAIDLVGGHHEKYDGTGYPLGLSGKNIPIAGRIAAVADVFDALTSKRPYKKALSLVESLEIVKSGSGSHFDPVVVHALEACFSDIRKIYEQYKEV